MEEISNAVTELCNALDMIENDEIVDKEI